MNKVILIGNLGKDPELTETPNGIPVCKFSLAVNRKYENAQGEKECDFFNIIAWRQLGENAAKFLSKGKKAAIVGELQARSWEDQHGDKKYITEVIASEIQFLSPKEKQEGNPNHDGSRGYGNPPPAQDKKTAAELKPVDDDDLPF